MRHIHRDQKQLDARYEAAYLQFVGIDRIVATKPGSLDYLLSAHETNTSSQEAMSGLFSYLACERGRSLTMLTQVWLHVVQGASLIMAWCCVLACLQRQLTRPPAAIAGL